jgi:hypothetical protein
MMDFVLPQYSIDSFSQSRLKGIVSWNLESVRVSK